MPSLAKITPEAKTTDIQIGSGTVRVTYRPRQIADTAEEEERRRQTAEDAGQNYQALELCRIITEWDVTGPIPTEDLPGHPVGSAWPSETDVVPLDPAVIRFIDQPTLSAFLAELTMDAQPDFTEMRNRSRGRGSTRTYSLSNPSPDELTRSPNGSTTS